MTHSDRNYDLVLFGASGFTGRLVATYLLKTYGIDKSLKWAMAGRNLEKLNRVRAQLGDTSIPVLQADSLDSASLDALTRQTKVLCTTVGPYAQYGDEVIASCVREGAHYCDLTGEVQWMRRMIDAHHDQARQKQVKIVHCCGFDSIPSDMGVYFLQGYAKETTGVYCNRIKTGLKAAKGGFSGGTIASLINVLAEAEQDKRIYGLLGDPYGLNPADGIKGLDEPDLRSVELDPHFQSWKSPFVMAPINTKVVRRSHALLGWPFGQNFRYEEFVLTGKGLGGKLKGYAASLPVGVMMQAKPGSVSKKILDWITPKPGKGPSEKVRENGFWVYDLIGILPNGNLIRARVSGDRDPGYGSTSKMLAEAAVCLAQDPLPPEWGVLTPAVAMGEVLLNRLRDHAGLTFKVKDQPNGIRSDTLG